MAECAGAAVDVDYCVLELEFGHQRHRHHGESLIDFPQVHILHTPAGLGQQLVYRPHWRGSEPFRLLGVHGVGHDTRQRRGTQACGRGGARHHQRGRAIVDRRAGCGGNRSVFFECGFEPRNLVEFDLARAFVDGHQHLTRAALDRHRRDFTGKRARLGGGLCPLNTGHGEFVLGATRKAVFGGAVLAKGAHGAASLVGVFQAVKHHVVEDLAVADTNAAAALGQQVRRVGHAFHATGHHHVVAAHQQHVMRHHGGFHARAAHLGQGHRARAFGQAALERGLPRRCLALTGHQAVAEQDLGHEIRRDIGAFHGGLDRGAAQVVCGQRGKVALEAAHGSARGTNDNNRIGSGS